MSSARLPEHGDSTLLGVPLAPARGAAPDSTPAGLFLNPAPVIRPAHLVPCAQCGAHNGRSALVCWSCEADLLALAPFVTPVVEPVIDAEPVPGNGSAVNVEARRALHLVSRADAPASVQALPAASAPAELRDLPVLTAMVENSVSAPPRLQMSGHRERPIIAMAIFAIALLAAAAGLRWSAPASAPLVNPALEPTVPRAAAAPERPNMAPVPAPAAAPDRAVESFSAPEEERVAAAADRPTRAAATSRAAPPARMLSAAPRPAPRPREIRETVSPPPAACTSNMAALGFCTLPPASAKE